MTYTNVLKNAIIVIGIMMLTACGGEKMKRFNITVGLDDALVDQPPTLRVDLVGVGAGDASLRDGSVDDYFRDDGLRQDLEASGQKTTMAFQAGRSEPQTLSMNDPIWENWERNNLLELMIIVDYLPGTASDTARRRILPLSDARWERGQNNLRITIQRSRLSVSPEPLPQ